MNWPPCWTPAAAPESTSPPPFLSWVVSPGRAYTISTAALWPTAYSERTLLNRSDLPQWRDIIAFQSDVPAVSVGTQVPLDLPDGVIIYDSASDEHLSAIAAQLQARGELKLLAGCAGFASALPDLLGMEGAGPRLPSVPQKLLVVCGSTNPITLRQLDEAAAQRRPPHPTHPRTKAG